MPALGKTLIILGSFLVVTGLLISLATKLNWSGRLPGDILIKKENFSFYMPVTSSILISVLLTLIAWFFRR